jgi:hypothetical protein
VIIEAVFLERKIKDVFIEGLIVRAGPGKLVPRSHLFFLSIQPPLPPADLPSSTRTYSTSTSTLEARTPLGAPEVQPGKLETHISSSATG